MIQKTNKQKKNNNLPLLSRGACLELMPLWQVSSSFPFVQKVLFLSCVTPEKVIPDQHNQRPQQSQQAETTSLLVCFVTVVNSSLLMKCVYSCVWQRQRKEMREKLPNLWFMKSCLSVCTSDFWSCCVCVCLCVCVSKWGGSFSGQSTTLRSPAEERPVCPSSSLGLWWLSDGDRPGMMRAPLLLAPPRSAARYARCYHPHGSVGEGKPAQSGSTLQIWDPEY